jgi:hypothetical protein
VSESPGLVIRGVIKGGALSALTLIRQRTTTPSIGELTVTAVDAGGSAPLDQVRGLADP